MSAIANPAAKVIWLIEHYADSTCLLGSILKKWHYLVVRILESEILAGEIENRSNLPLPDLIILDLAPHQKNVINAIEYFRHNLALDKIPLLYLCTFEEENRGQSKEIETIKTLNKPFELEDLYFHLRELWAETPKTQASSSTPEMTFVFSEIESTSSIKEQEHWLKVFQEHSEQDAYKLLMAAGYEVKAPIFIVEE